MTPSPLQDSRVHRIVELALLDDGTLGDVTTESIVPESARGDGALLCKEDGVIAGLELAGMVFRACDPGIAFEPRAADGSAVGRGQEVAEVRGGLRGILRAERPALNLLQRMSGIATLTRKYVEAVRGTGARITDTRKTAPGLRMLDKLAVRLGGGVNHRFGLDDMALIKDNHIVAAGSITAAVQRCTSYLKAHWSRIAVEVEARTLDDVREALKCGGVTRIMLDNFDLAAMKEAVHLIAHRVEVEASGGITLPTVRSYAETGVDFISVGALTHSVQALDLSLELAPHA